MLLTHESKHRDEPWTQEATPSISTLSGVDLYHHISSEKSQTKAEPILFTKSPDSDKLQDNISRSCGKGKKDLGNYFGRDLITSQVSMPLSSWWFLSQL